jgi:hypothetical protein
MNDGTPTAALDNVFVTALDFVDSAIQDITRLETEKQGLHAKLADTERVILEKVAAAKAAALDPDAINAAVDRLVTLKIIPFELHAKVASQVRKNPNSALSLLTQVAEQLISAPAEGSGVSKEAGTVEDGGDLDGWDDVLQGRVPQIRPPAR